MEFESSIFQVLKSMAKIEYGKICVFRLLPLFSFFKTESKNLIKINVSYKKQGFMAAV